MLGWCFSLAWVLLHALAPQPQPQGALPRVPGQPVPKTKLRRHTCSPRRTTLPRVKPGCAACTGMHARVGQTRGDRSSKLAPTLTHLRAFWCASVCDAWRTPVCLDDACARACIAWHAVTSAAAIRGTRQDGNAWLHHTLVRLIGHARTWLPHTNARCARACAARCQRTAARARLWRGMSAVHQAS